MQPSGHPPRSVALLVNNAFVSDTRSWKMASTLLNHRLNVPTKLLDAMGAGVPVVASNLPGMAQIVRSTGAGELFDPDDPSDIARAIRKVLGATEERRAVYRQGGLAATSGQYGWERQAETLRRLYADLPVLDRGAPSASQVSG